MCLFQITGVIKQVCRRAETDLDAGPGSFGQRNDAHVNSHCSTNSAAGISLQCSHSSVLYRCRGTASRGRHVYDISRYILLHACCVAVDRNAVGMMIGGRHDVYFRMGGAGYVFVPGSLT